MGDYINSIISTESEIIINNYWMRFFDIQNNQGGGKSYQPKPKAEADNPYRDLDYSGYHKNRI